MATSKVFPYLLAVLIPLAFIHCQDIPSFPSIPGLPNIPGIQNFPGLPNIRGHRQAPNPDSDDGGHAHHGRFLFSLIHGTDTSCNFTTEAGRTCRSCAQTLICRPGDTGTIHTCQEATRGFFPYCKAGSCSLNPGPACLPPRPKLR